jgi:hypothetical protein
MRTHDSEPGSSTGLKKKLVSDTQKRSDQVAKQRAELAARQQTSLRLSTSTRIAKEVANKLEADLLSLVLDEVEHRKAWMASSESYESCDDPDSDDSTIHSFVGSEKAALRFRSGSHGSIDSMGSASGRSSPSRRGSSPSRRGSSSRRHTSGGGGGGGGGGSDKLTSGVARGGERDVAGHVGKVGGGKVRIQHIDVPEEFAAGWEVIF